MTDAERKYRLMTLLHDADAVRYVGGPAGEALRATEDARWAEIGELIGQLWGRA